MKEGRYHLHYYCSKGRDEYCELRSRFYSFGIMAPGFLLFLHFIPPFIIVRHVESSIKCSKVGDIISRHSSKDEFESQKREDGLYTHR